jgi:hypothetical protein
MSTGSWGAITADRLEPSAWLTIATGMCALAAVMIDGVWRWTRNVVTIVHEGGHALTAVLTGRRLTGIRLHSDTSGLTVSVGKPSGLGMVATAAAGYVSPSLVGLAGVALLAADQVTVMLWAGTAVLLCMLVMIRNLYGAATLVIAGAAVVAVSLYTSPGVQAAFGYTVTWFLLLGGVRPVGELLRQRRSHRRLTSDADQLARLTHVPAGLWVGVFGIVTLGALVLGGWALLT